MTAKMNRKAHATCRKSSDRRRILSSGAFRSKILFGSRLGQTEKSQNSPSGKVLKIFCVSGFRKNLELNGQTMLALSPGLW